MVKRLQVVLQDREYQEIQRAARSRRMSIAEWVRSATIRSPRQEPSGVAQKLEAIRAATRYSFPTADIDVMLAGIESGCTGKNQ